MAFRTTFLTVVAITFAGQLVAVAFEIAVAARFGTGREADALAFALTLLVTLSAEIVGWVSTLFVPLYIDARAASPAGAAALLRRGLAALLAATIAAALLLTASAPALLALLAPALGARGVAVLRACAPLLVVVPLAALFAATLQAHGRFVAASARQLAWYGGGVTGLLVLGGALGAVAVPLGMLAGTLVFAGAMAVLAFRVAGPRRGAGTGPSPARVGALLLPLLLISAAMTVNVTVERALAAHLPEGSLAALTYAYRLLHFPLALFMTNATTMLLPALAGHAVRGESTAVDALTQRALRLAIVFVVPVAALTLALAEPLTRVVLERGAFTAASTDVTAAAIAWYAPGVVALALAQILVRVYQASHALWRLAWTTGAGMVVNVALMTTLTALLGFPGLPLASSLSAFALVALMIAGLRGQAHGLGDAVCARPTIAVVVAGGVAAAAAWVVQAFTGPAAIAALVSGAAAGVAVYAGALRALAPAEARAALAFVVPAVQGRLA